MMHTLGASRRNSRTGVWAYLRSHTLLLLFAVVGLTSSAHATTRWEVPLLHQTYPESRDMTGPAANLVVELGDDTLTVRATMPDKQASALRGARTPPDGFGSSDTHTVIYIDPNGDAQFAQVFGLNIANAIQDGLYRESTKNQDTGVDFAWEGETRVTETGWEAVFRIPIKTLYRSGKGGTPRIYAEYWRVADKSENYSTHDTSADGGCLLCKAPKLSGFGAAASGYPVWSLRPSVIAEVAQSSLAGGGTSSEHSLRSGLDFSVRTSPAWTLAGTSNPNFSDREPDQPAFTKDAQFAPWLGETRPFFTQGSDLFRVASFIHTRQIANPSFAVQATGRGESFSSKWLLAQDLGGSPLVTPGTYGSGYARAPASRNFAGRGILATGDGDVGFAVTDRTYEAAHGSNQVMALDTHQSFAGDSRFVGALAYSQTSACALAGELVGCPRFSGHFANALVIRKQDLLEAGIFVEDASANFRSDLGWRTQNGYRLFNVWWWPSTTSGLPSVLSRVDSQPEVYLRQDASGRVMGELVPLGARWTFKSGPTLFMLVAPLSRERLDADQSLINTRNLSASLSLSPSTAWQNSSVGLTVGELPDYFNRRAASGYSINTDQSLSPSRALSMDLNGRWTSSQAKGVAVDGPTIREGVALLKFNYQYAVFSRLRWTTQWQRYMGVNLVTMAEFSGSTAGHSMAWIHEPRVGWSYSATVSRQRSQDNSVSSRTNLATFKAGYAFW